MEITINDISHIHQAASLFAEHIGSNRIFAFYGSMGVGKTTFIKALCEVLGVEDVITSPTFAIVNQYTIAGELPAAITSDTVYHFDFYRIHRLEEVYDMGFEDYFYSEALCLIEWPELIEDILPTDAVKVLIKEHPDGARTITF